MSGAERRARQAQIEREFEADMNERPNVPPPPRNPAKCCQANLAGGHDYTMKGVDGKYRCWFCCRLPSEVIS